MKLYAEAGVTLNNNAFEYMFLTYKPKEDYNDEYLKIINFR